MAKDDNAFRTQLYEDEMLMLDDDPTLGDDSKAGDLEAPATEAAADGEVTEESAAKQAAAPAAALSSEDALAS